MQEVAAGTDPYNPDSDGDGMPDGYEVANGLNPLVNDALDDLDGDRYPNIFEYKQGTKVAVAGLVPDPQNPVSNPPPIYVVDPAGGGTHTTIQAAIDQATYGYYDPQSGQYVAGTDYAIIQVKAGLYIENPSINNKKVLLVGEVGSPAGPTTIVGTLSIYTESVVDGFLITNGRVRSRQCSCCL